MIQVVGKPHFNVFLGISPVNVANTNEEHPVKQKFSNDVTEEGIVILDKLEQPLYPLMVDYQCFDSDTIEK